MASIFLMSKEVTLTHLLRRFEQKRHLLLRFAGFLSVCCLLIPVARGVPVATAAAETSGDTAPESMVRVGFSKVDITPTRPTAMAGYYHERLSTATHDPLWCRTTVLEVGDSRVALVSLDLIRSTQWITEETQRLVAEKGMSELQGKNFAGILISATHSHTGPVIFNSDSKISFSKGSTNNNVERYTSDLPALICKSVIDAYKAAEPMSVQVAVGEEKNLAFNRRFFMNDGTVGWNPGKLNPRIVREAGPTDDGLPVVVFRDEKKVLRGILCNFSIHLDTVGGTSWSADMPYQLIQSLESVYGPACHIQYSTGCCGDVNHLDVRTPLPQSGHGEAARIGNRLAAAVTRTVREARTVEAKKLIATSERVSLPLTSFTAEELAWAKEIGEKATTPTPPSFGDMVKGFRILDVEHRQGRPWEVDIHVISLGDKIAFVSQPGEIFVQLGLMIKDGSPFEVTSVHELANGFVGYVPTRQAYPQGAYEVVSARVDAGSGEMMVESALKQLAAHYSAHVAPE